jgi:hypothetical protein
LVSSRDTSESEDSGQHDKLPVPAHRGRTTRGQEALQSTKNILPRHRFLPGTPYVQLEKNPVGEPSLSGEPECLSLHSSLLTEEGERGNWAAGGAEPSVGPFIPPPRRSDGGFQKGK